MAATLALSIACAHGKGAVDQAGQDTAAPVHVKILAINDFHGQLPAGRKVAGRPASSAPVLAAYLEAARTGIEDRTFIVHAGDLVGASPAASSLLRDEPTIHFMNQFANQHCRVLRPAAVGASTADWDRGDPACNMVGTFGNHEFDRGREELFRLVYGGDATTGPAFVTPYLGARFPYVSANVVEAKSGRPIAPPYVVREVRGVRVAFIGATLKGAPTIVAAAGIQGLQFLDEAESINRYVPEIQRSGVHAIVAVIHQGGSQKAYEGSTQAAAAGSKGDIVDIVAHLDADVDLVISGHSHSFTNALLPNAGGKPVLVTQAFSSGTAYADIDLGVSPVSQDIVTKSASINSTFADAGPGLSPDPRTAALVRKAEEMVAPLTQRVIGQTAAELTNTASPAGESALGDLIADSQRAAMKADVALMNPGGIRANLPAGKVTWGQVYAVQPFGNSLVQMKLTGSQLVKVLEQQWVDQPQPRILQVSGMTFSWSVAAPAGSKVKEIQIGGRPLDPAALYSVVVNNFLADGGDGFGVLTQGGERLGGPLDLDAFVSYAQGLPQPISPPMGGRITRLP
jgi:5'-nucleotidase